MGTEVEAVAAFSPIHLVAERTGELCKILTHARTIVWYAEIHERPEGGCLPQRYHWETRIHHEDAAQQVFPLDVPSGRSYHEMWLWSRHPLDAARAAETSVNALSNGLSQYITEYRCYDRNGRERWFEEDVRLERLGAGHWHAFGNCNDVTDRRFVQEARAIGQRHRTLVKQIPDPIYLADAESRRLIESNPAFQRLLGYSEEEVTRLQMYDFVVAPRCDIDQRIAQAIQTGFCPCGERQYRCKDGTLLDVEPNMSSLVEGGRRVLCVVARDIARRKAAEEKILAYQQQLCAAASELCLAEERERRRLALALHDGVGQMLAVSRMKLEALMDSPKGCPHIPGLQDILKLIMESIRQTRSLTSELSPPILYEQGLEPALEWLARHFEREHGLEVSFVNDHRPKVISEDVRILLFRAARELLFNVIKHAKARSVCISVHRTDQDQLSLSVLDDGVGYDTTGHGAASSPQPGYGLFSIRDRLRRMGGQIMVDSAPGNGTCVTLELPLHTT